MLLAGFALLGLVHHDVQHFAERLVAHSHLNPAAHYPRIFVDAAARVTDSRLMLLAAGAALYSLVRFVEAYGLWRARDWAEWFAAIAGVIYIPFELLELHHRETWLGAAALVVNIAIVALMLYAVRRRRNP